MTEVQSYYCGNLFIYFLSHRPKSQVRRHRERERGKRVNLITLQRTVNNLGGFYMNARASLKKEGVGSRSLIIVTKSTAIMDLPGLNITFSGF